MGQQGCDFCKKTVGLFYTVRFTDKVGWCSQECFEKGKALEKKERYKTVLEERMRIIQQTTRAPYFTRIEE